MRQMTKEQCELFEALHTSRLEAIKIFNRREFRGVWNSIIDKYPEAAHFVYELLQNADDAEASEVLIKVYPQKMYFKHNGKKHFDITDNSAKIPGDINAITGIGNSTKGDAQNKIGKFGVGFKAVFQYTDVPEIYDDIFKFKIEEHIVPILLNKDHPERKDGETLFVFPFKNSDKSYEDIVKRVETLKSPILFLENLENIKIEVEAKDKTKSVYEYSKKRLQSIMYKDGVFLTKYLLTNPKSDNEVLMFGKNIDVIDDDKTTNHTIYVAFYYNSTKKEIITRSKQDVFCFFPTKENFNTCYVCHAPFLLTDNRQNLKPNETINDFLVKELAKLATESILHLRDYGISERNILINENIVDIIPNYFTTSSHTTFWHNPKYERIFIESFNKFVECEKIFLSRSGKYLSKNNSFTGSPKDLVELLSPEQLKYLTKKNEDVDFLKWELNKRIIDNDLIKNSYTAEHLATDITSQFMMKQEQKWVSKMYHYIKETARSLWNFSPNETKKETAYKPFRKAPIIKLQTGDWVAPYTNTLTPNVFLPLSNTSNKEYNFIHEEYLNDENAKVFFTELGIGIPDKNDYIRQIIIKKYTKEDEYIEDSELLSDLDFLLSYYLELTEEENKDKLINLLKDNILLSNENSELLKPRDLYIADKMLRQFIDNNKRIILDEDFYKGIINKYKKDVFVEFIRKLGVSTIPKIEKKHFKESLYSLPKTISQQLSDLENVSEWNILDYSLSHFAESLLKRNWSKELSVYIWNKVLPNYKFEDVEYLDLSYRLHRKRSFYVANKKYFSSFKEELTKKPWLYDINNNQKAPVCIVIEDLPIEYDRDEKIIRFLGIKRRERSIIELGGTQEQQKALELGRKIQEIAPNMSNEEIVAYLTEKSKEKRNEVQVANKIDNNDTGASKNSDDSKEYELTNIEDILQEKWNQKANSNIGRPRHTNQNENFEFRTINNTNLSNNTEPFFNETIVSTIVNNIDIDKNDTKKIEKKLESRNNEAQEAAKKANEQKQIYELLKETPQYSFKWFKLLMELMHADRSNVSCRHLQIDFSKKEFICEDKILHLSNPTQPVPSWILDAEKVSISTLAENPKKIEGVVVKVDDVSIDVSIEATEELKSICKVAKKIRIIADNSTNIIDSLETRFIQLGYDDDYDMNKNLTNDIEFIYGPPGTGKTTRLVKMVSDILKLTKEKVSILVLTPTNKAADVVAEKMSRDSACYNHLTRFGATESLYLIEDVAVVTNRDTFDITNLQKNVVVTTAARYAYDYIQPDETFLCDYNWDYIIIDEASIVDIVTCTYILYKGTPAKFIISGDPKQIPPVTLNDMPEYNIYDMVGLNDFSEAVNNYTRYNVITLKTQYRSIPAIGDLVSKFTYNEIVKSDPQRAPQKPLKLDKMNINNINFIGFDIIDFDLIKGLTSISDSAFQLYSAIFTYKFAEYIIKQITEKYPGKEYSIGIVSPYRAEADAIKQLLENRSISTKHCSITCGTVHSFQGDECDIMLIVLNPPLQCSKGSHINKQNIINVAMSRARDYIFFIMPQGQPNGMIIKELLGKMTQKSERAMFFCGDIEEIMFGNRNHIVSNTHVTCHMPVNVYCEETSMYEVRISNDALDIKVNEQVF